MNNRTAEQPNSRITNGGPRGDAWPGRRNGRLRELLQSIASHFVPRRSAVRLFVLALFTPITLIGGPSHATAGSIPTGLRDTTFVAFDVETTGLSAARHRVIEIGAVKLRAGRIIARQAWLINPGQPIPPFSTRIHGITDADVAEAPPFPATYPKFVAFVKGTILIAHNASFDVRFMAHEAARNSLTCPPEPVLDNLRLARKWYPELERHGLKAVADYLKIEPGRYHRALDDSEVLAQIFMEGLRRMPPDSTVSNLLTTAGNALYIKPAVTLNSTPAQSPR